MPQRRSRADTKKSESKGIPLSTILRKAIDLFSGPTGGQTEIDGQQVNLLGPGALLESIESAPLNLARILPVFKEALPAALDILKRGVITKSDVVSPALDFGHKLRDNAKRAFRVSLQNSQYDEREAILKAISRFTGSTTGTQRLRSLLQEASLEGFSELDRDTANALRQLLSAAPPSRIPLFRGSRLEEIPRLREGEIFSNPALSFSSRMGTAREFSDEIRGGIMSLSPGSKALPVSVFSDIPSELEFISGGNFRIKSLKTLPRSDRKLLQIERIGE